MEIGSWGNDILGKVPFRKESVPEDVEFVRVSVRELGFKDGAYRRDIYKAALEQGLELCLPEDGPALRLAYKNQPVVEWVLMGMEPITDSLGCANVFNLERDDDGVWLSASDGNAALFWNGNVVWVFRRKKV